jgi:hypothetical protein
MEQPEVGAVELPAMRAQVVEALRALGDVEYQRASWGRVAADGSFDDLALNVHILYDDCQVLPDPAIAVHAILREAEIDAFLQLEAALGPILDDLGDSKDEVYIRDNRWKEVARAARVAFQAMHPA